MCIIKIIITKNKFKKTFDKKIYLRDNIIEVY